MTDSPQSADIQFGSLREKVKKGLITAEAALSFLMSGNHPFVSDSLVKFLKRRMEKK